VARNTDEIELNECKRRGKEREREKEKDKETKMFVVRSCRSCNRACIKSTEEREREECVRNERKGSLMVVKGSLNGEQQKSTFSFGQNKRNLLKFSTEQYKGNSCFGVNSSDASNAIQMKANRAVQVVRVELFKNERGGGARR
jgi:hypothetical protein